MEHTPGPWEAVGTGVYAETPNGSREIIFSRHNTRSAEEPERRANARLIAAAPSLLEIMREMITAATSRDELEPCWYCGETYPHADGCVLIRAIGLSHSLGDGAA